MILAAYALGQQPLRSAWAVALVFVVWADPVVAGQSTLVSPDLALAAFFLIAVYSFFKNLKWWSALALFGLCLISMRGAMTAAALLAWQVVEHRNQLKAPSQWLKWALVFFPGFAAAAAYQLWHYRQTGWIGYHPASPWAPAFQPADVQQFCKNIAVVAWRWLDFGRWAEWLLLFALVLHFRNRNHWPPHFKSSAVLSICLLLLLSPSALLYQNLSAHRYFLPLFLALHLCVFYGLMHADWSSWQKKVLCLGLALSLLTGNLWIYPRGISMDWDATLAHLPYHALRSEMMTFIDRSKVPLAEIGTAFPNVNSGEHLLLDGDTRKFAEIDFEKNQYILASNVYNDFSIENLDRLKADWRLLQRLEYQGVWLALYKKPVPKL